MSANHSIRRIGVGFIFTLLLAIGHANLAYAAGDGGGDGGGSGGGSGDGGGAGGAGGGGGAPSDAGIEARIDTACITGIGAAAPRKPSFCTDMP